MKRILVPIAVAALGLAAACDGPREQAGEKADAASGAVNSEDSIDKGPAERLGEAQDRVEDNLKDAKEAQADALDDAANAAREQADQQADEMEKRAEQIRGK